MIISRAFGFGLWTSWLWMLFLEGPLLAPTADIWHLDAGNLFLLYMFANSAGLFYLGVKMRPRSSLTGGLLPRTGVVLMMLGPLLLAGIPLLLPASAAATKYIVPVLTFLSGLGGAIAASAWLECFIHLRLGAAAPVFAGATVIAAITTILAATIPYLWGMAAATAMPYLSYLLLKKQQLSPPPSPEISSPAIADKFYPFSAKLIILFALFYTAGGLMFKIVTLEQTYPYLFYLANGSYALVCLLVGLMLYYKPAIDLRLIYRPVLPLLGIGFIFFVAKIQFALLPFLLLQAGFALFDMYTWLLIAYLARFHALPASVCSLGLFLITFTIFCGNLMFTIWMDLAGKAATDSLAIIAGMLSLLAVLVFSDNRETFSGWDMAIANKAADAGAGAAATFVQPASAQVMTACRADSDVLPDLPSLTARENEVLLLLLKGRNNRFIGGALNISVNTVKYHVRNLYDKFQVNSRQELLDFVDKINRDKQ